ncbi:MAG: cytochrome P450, partial [Proteobacteria bacterium]|nr:cytochrome P450 [Pseudomonadota bacterium]
FGGVSTVEAVILNMVWALLTHRTDLEQVREYRDLLDAVFDETVRWQSPVQSATRHTVRPCEIAGVRIPAGATVNCMLASANRDEAVFDEPDVFDLRRPNARRHLGFAAGPHFCLGRYLARVEALAALNALMDLGENLRMTGPSVAPTGHEFRQPASLPIAWD